MKKLTRIISILLVICSLTALFVACGSKDTDKGSSTTKPSDTKPSGTTDSTAGVTDNTDSTEDTSNKDDTEKDEKPEEAPVLRVTPVYSFIMLDGEPAVLASTYDDKGNRTSDAVFMLSEFGEGISFKYTYKEGKLIEISEYEEIFYTAQSPQLMYRYVFADAEEGTSKTTEVYDSYGSVDESRRGTVIYHENGALKSLNIASAKKEHLYNIALDKDGRCLGFTFDNYEYRITVDAEKNSATATYADYKVFFFSMIYSKESASFADMTTGENKMAYAFSYDSKGYLVSLMAEMSNLDGQIVSQKKYEFKYSEENDMTGLFLSTRNIKNEWVVDISYELERNELGLISKMTENTDTVTVYKYSTEGKLTEEWQTVKLEGKPFSEYKKLFDGHENIISLEKSVYGSDGKIMASHKEVYENKYDEKDRLTEILFKSYDNGKLSASSWKETYTYTENGSINSKKEESFQNTDTVSVKLTTYNEKGFKVEDTETIYDYGVLFERLHNKYLGNSRNEDPIYSKTEYFDDEKLIQVSLREYGENSYKIRFEEDTYYLNEVIQNRRTVTYTDEGYTIKQESFNSEGKIESYEVIKYKYNPDGGADHESTTVYDANGNVIS